MNMYIPTVFFFLKTKTMATRKLNCTLKLLQSYTVVKLLFSVTVIYTGATNTTCSYKGTEKLNWRLMKETINSTCTHRGCVDNMTCVDDEYCHINCRGATFRFPALKNVTEAFFNTEMNKLFCEENGITYNGTMRFHRIPEQNLTWKEFYTHFIGGTLVLRCSCRVCDCDNNNCSEIPFICTCGGIVNWDISTKTDTSTSNYNPTQSAGTDTSAVSNVPTRTTILDESVTGVSPTLTAICSVLAIAVVAVGVAIFIFFRRKRKRRWKERVALVTNPTYPNTQVERTPTGLDNTGYDELNCDTDIHTYDKIDNQKDAEYSYSYASYDCSSQNLSNQEKCYSSNPQQLSNGQKPVSRTVINDYHGHVVDDYRSESFPENSHDYSMVKNEDTSGDRSEPNEKVFENYFKLEPMETKPLNDVNLAGKDSTPNDKQCPLDEHVHDLNDGKYEFAKTPKQEVEHSNKGMLGITSGEMSKSQDPYDHVKTFHSLSEANDDSDYDKLRKPNTRYSYPTEDNYDHC